MVNKGGRELKEKTFSTFGAYIERCILQTVLSIHLYMNRWIDRWPVSVLSPLFVHSLSLPIAPGLAC